MILKKNGASGDGWIVVVNDSNYEVKYRVDAKIAHVYAKVKNNSTISLSSWLTIAIVPIKPVSDIYYCAVVGTSSERLNFYMSTAGQVQVLGNTGASAMLSFPI